MTLTNITYALLMLLCGFLVAKLISARGIAFLEKKYPIKNGLIIRRLLFYLILVLFVVMALHQMGFQLGVLLGAAGIFSVAIGFASKTSMSNVISGLFLLGEGAFSVGDTIKIGNTVGEVISVDWLSVKLRTPDNMYVRLPNETIIVSEMTNLTRFKIRRFDLNISVAYKENLPKVKALLLELTRKDNQCLEDPEPMIVYEGFGESGVNIRLAVWAKSEEFLKFKSHITEKVKDALDAAGIEIPFPHLSIYAGENTAPIPFTLVESGKNAGDNPFER